MRTCLTILLFILELAAVAQEDHYWNTQIGAKSSLTGGSVTASVRDNSAIYYNPGALGFLDRSNISVTASFYNYRNNFMENAVGEKYNLFYHTMEANPQFISGVIKIPKVEQFTFVFAGFNTVNSTNKFTYRNNIMYDILPQEGKEHFLGRFTYKSMVREDWAGIGMAVKSWERSSFGVSTFAVFRSLETSYDLNTQIFDRQNINNSMANSTLRRDVDLFMVSNVWKFGYAYESPWLRLGATITTPGIPLDLFSSGRLAWREELQVNAEPVNNLLMDAYEERLKPRYKYPLNIDVGTQFVFYKSTLSLRLSWFAPLGDYRLLSFTDQADYVSNLSRDIPDKLSSVWYNGKNMVNVGIGFERPLTERFNLLLGFNTNKNAVDKFSLVEQGKWVPTISYWGLYNFSFGLDVVTKSNDDLAFGFTFGITQRKGDKQIVNLSDPEWNLDQNNHFIGTPTPTMNTQILNIGLVFGYTFNFKSKLERDLLDETRKRIKRQQEQE